MKKSTINNIKNKLFELTNNEYMIINDNPNEQGKFLLRHNKCKYEWYVNIDNVLNGSGCLRCSKRERPTIEFLKEYFEKNNCKLLSTEYIGNAKKLDYICECGNIGHTSWNKFYYGQRCGKCRVKKIKNTKKEKYGNSNYNNIKKIQETNLKKYGCKNISQNKKIKEKIKQTNLKKYGYENYFHEHARYSKISQELFWNIYNQLPLELKEKTYFAELNKEFESFGKNFYLYDFVISNIKICIEFNGNKFHPTPELKDEDINWNPFNKNLSAKEARIFEENKLNFMKNNGYDILIIWEDKYKKNKQDIILQCLNFINKERL